MSARHLVERIVIDLDWPLPAGEKQRAQTLAAQLRDDLNKRLLAVFDRFDNDLFYQIDQMDIELKLDSSQCTPEQIGAHLERSLSRQLQQLASSKKDPLPDQRTREITSIFFFLEKGRWPWYQEAISWKEIEILIRRFSEKDQLRFQELLYRSTNILERLIHSASDTLLRSLVYRWSSDGRQRWQLYRRFWVRAKRATPSPGIFRLAFLKQLISSQLSQTKQSIKVLQKVFEQTFYELIKTQKTKQILAAKVSSQEEETQLLDEGIYLADAGLILLHPFLKMLFERLSLLKKNQFVDRPAQYKAIHLLHYLVWGRPVVHEAELIFEKYLCQFPIEAPVPLSEQLEEADQAACEQLLEAAIRHWTALKNTSPAGLREGFLQRPGKLITTEDKHQLTIERQGHDVLLNSLPWNLSLVKFPWKPSLITVNW